MSGLRAGKRRKEFGSIYGVAGALTLAALLSACDLPRDPDDTLARVRGGTLRVGEVEGNTQAATLDRAIVALLSERLGARPQIETGDAHALFHKLKEGEIDLLVGGVPTSTPFKEAGLSRAAGPLFLIPDEERALAVRPGENGFLIEVNAAIERHKAGAGASGS